MGIEAETHEASMRILAEAGMPEQPPLHKLDWFRKIRRDPDCRGYSASPEQAKEIANFWKRHSKGIIAFIEKRIKE